MVFLDKTHAPLVSAGRLYTSVSLLRAIGQSFDMSFYISGDAVVDHVLRCYKSSPKNLCLEQLRPLLARKVLCNCDTRHLWEICFNLKYSVGELTRGGLLLAPFCF